VRPIYCPDGLIDVKNVRVYSANSDLFNVWGGYNCRDENGSRKGTKFLETQNPMKSVTWNNPLGRYLLEMCRVSFFYTLTLP
jgi:hypothetical protein